MAIRIDWETAYGLPGGHVDEGETPDQAMERELWEECGVHCDNLVRKDFFMHRHGKLVLAYVGTLNDESLASQQDDDEGVPEWLTREEFEAVSIEPAYRKFVLENW